MTINEKLQVVKEHSKKMLKNVREHPVQYTLVGLAGLVGGGIAFFYGADKLQEIYKTQPRDMAEAIAYALSRTAVDANAALVGGASTATAALIANYLRKG